MKRLRVAVVALALVAAIHSNRLRRRRQEHGGKAGSTSSREDMRIEFAFAGVPGDPYYTVIKNGAAQAEKDMGVDVEYKETRSTTSRSRCG